MDAKTLNSLYERFKIEPDLATQPFYDALLKYAAKIGRVHFESHYENEEFRDVCHDGGTDVFLNLSKFRGVNSKGKPCAFATFAQWSITHDLLNWIEKQGTKEVVTLDDAEHPIDVLDDSISLDTKAYYAQTLDRLTKPEHALFTLVSAGYSHAYIAEMMGLSREAVSKRWQLLTEKLKKVDASGTQNRVPSA